MENRFDIPVVLIIFKRKDTVLRIIEQIKAVRPTKIYLLADAGRDVEENRLVLECRNAVESAIDWDCEVIKNYAKENRGVHANIGLGAMWVFDQEEKAIFLEDDNYPTIGFFNYCKECLEKYKEDEEIFWICGTNYLQKCAPANGASVFKSQHLMPCGWASWSSKFKKYYDYDFKMASDELWEKKLKKKYKDKKLYLQQRGSIKGEISRRLSTGAYRSWDYHTLFSIKMNDLWGIVPKYNQIENIGVDDFSTHGGTSMNIEMTKRFCGINTYELELPLDLPEASKLDSKFESAIGEIILYPFKNWTIMVLRDLLSLPENVRLRNAISYYIKNRK